MDCELGRLNVNVPPPVTRTLAPNERIHSLSIIDRLTRLTLRVSYRLATEELNLSLHRKDGETFAATTIRDMVERLGIQANAAIEKDLLGTLSDYGIDNATGEAGDLSTLPKGVPLPSLSSLDTQDSLDLTADVLEVNEHRAPLECIKDLSLAASVEGCRTKTVLVSIDSVYSPHQAETRKTKDPAKRKTKVRCETAVVHIQADGKSYIFTTTCTDKACALTLGYLLKFDLLRDHALIFLSDGARDIKAGVAKWFSYWNHRLVLDWFHLKKRCYECLSMGLYIGKTKEQKVERQNVARDLLRMLWVGNVTEACTFLDHLEGWMVKSKHRLAELKDYLERKRENLTCYALRRKRGLRLSSNAVEKANDQVVSSRQKHNGMSWGLDGSLGLAQVTALHIMNGLEKWIVNREIQFSMSVLNSSNEDRVEKCA